LVVVSSVIEQASFGATLPLTADRDEVLLADAGSLSESESERGTANLLATLKLGIETLFVLSMNRKLDRVRVLTMTFSR
jgi:hypothetical protein